MSHVGAERLKVQDKYTSACRRHLGYVNKMRQDTNVRKRMNSLTTSLSLSVHLCLYKNRLFQAQLLHKCFCQYTHRRSHAFLKTSTVPRLHQSQRVWNPVCEWMSLCESNNGKDKRSHRIIQLYKASCFVHDYCFWSVGVLFFYYLSLWAVKLAVDDTTATCSQYCQYADTKITVNSVLLQCIKMIQTIVIWCRTHRFLLKGDFGISATGIICSPGLTHIIGPSSLSVGVIWFRLEKVPHGRVSCIQTDKGKDSSLWAPPSLF